MSGYDGDCLVTRIDDPIEGTKLRVDKADARILVAAELIEEIEKGSNPDCAITDGVLQIVGVNRTVAYRIGERGYDGPIEVYRAERIDES